MPDQYFNCTFTARAMIAEGLISYCNLDYDHNFLILVCFAMLRDHFGRERSSRKSQK